MPSTASRYREGYFPDAVLSPVLVDDEADLLCFFLANTSRYSCVLHNTIYVIFMLYIICDVLYII
jgi:hypothetical protein